MTRSTRGSARRFVVALTLALGTGALLACGNTPAPRVHTVEISGLAFHPAELNVAVGDTVVWVNRDIFPHTATASGASGWDTGTLAEGMSGRVVVSDGAELSYRCSLHPTMQGRLIVIR